MKITVYEDLDGIEAEWRSFQREAAGTFYQSFEWCSAWIETVGRDADIRARIVTGKDEQGQLRFLLPFGLRRRWGATVVEWIGSSQINYGYGLYHKSFLPSARQWFGAEGWSVLHELGQFDALRLQEMPEHLHGFPHPLLDWTTVPAANRSYAMSLHADYEQIYAAKRSGETRRGNRKRDAKLEKIGNVTFGLPGSIERTHALLDLMFQHQQSRLAESGIRSVFTKEEREFVHRLAEKGDILLPYHLSIDGELAAMMLGARFDNTYWALISSLNAGIARRHSPGDAALRRMIEACCKLGLTRLDFSSGDTPYKMHWADEVLQMREAIRFRTISGLPFAVAMLSTVTAKRAVKQSTILWRLFSMLRARIHGDTKAVAREPDSKTEH
jgi:CelD/BcsL family acetyltransferase involved in cellulose biosynthesis